MEKLLNFIQEKPVLAATTFGVATYCTVKMTKIVSYMLMGKAFAKMEKRPNYYEDGVIYFHTFPKIFRQHLSMSPYAIKVETWMRLHKIPYQVVETMKLSSSTAQIPYIILDGEEIADSNKIICHLQKKFNIPENEGLNDEQQAISHCLLRTVDESFAWTYATLRYLHYDQFYTDLMVVPASKYIKNLIIKEMKRMVSIRFKQHGIGRKTIPDIAEIAGGDIRALSKYLATKKFLMCDSITKVDCAVFAHLTQVIYVGLEYPHKKIIKEECQNILPYMERIKSELWPDWDELVTQ